jgi:hypothetical protein
MCFIDCSSTSVTTSIMNSSAVSDISSTLLQTSTKVDTSIIATQTLNFNTCPTFVANCAGGFDVIQQMTGQFYVINSITNDSAIAIQKSLSNAISQAGGATGSSSSDLFSVGSSSTVSADDVSNYVNQLVQTTMNLQTINDIIHSFNFTQTQNLNLCGTINANPNACTFNQYMCVNLIVDTIVSNVANAVSNDSFLLSLQQQGSASGSSQVNGLGSLIQQLGADITGIFTTGEWGVILLIGAVIIGLIVIAVVFLRLFKRSPSNPTVVYQSQPAKPLLPAGVVA